jgi:hypothetical protein
MATPSEIAENIKSLYRNYPVKAYKGRETNKRYNL